jgi:alkanesulfonate monooxygenase SsuD/methylene tetrahydromethanopterin reductase-like flavin-dependent oxidoreductase (luciferase family)
LKIGWSIPQSTSRRDDSIKFATACEELGFDSVWVYDHLMPYWLHDAPSLDGFTLLSTVAARTSRIHVGTLVTNVVLRNPGVLSKMTATIDRVSEGRLILGLGIGDRRSRKELESYGYPYLPWNMRLRRLEASIAVLRAIWTGTQTSMRSEDVRFHGISRPTPVWRVPIWIGGKHLDLGRLAAKVADGWNLWGIPFHEIERRIRSVTGDLHDRREFELSWAGSISRRVDGSVDMERTLSVGGEPSRVAAQLQFLESVGIRHVIFYPERGFELDLLAWFANEVLPMFRR